jgi:hypothetical protein
MSSKKGARKWSPGNKFVRVDRWLIESDAYRDLTSGARDVLLELMYRYNGSNNGAINMSVREVAERTNCAVGTAQARIQELKDHGFLKVAKPGSFTQKQRHATEWTLTIYGIGKELPTQEFKGWRKQNTVSKTDTNRYQPLTLSFAHGTNH